MPFDLTGNVNLERDDQGVARSLEHVQQPYLAAPTARAAPTPQALAQSYLNEPAVKRAYGLDDALLSDLSAAVPSLAADRLGAEGSRLRVGEEKSLMGTNSVAYQQTFDGLPVWEAGIAVTVQDTPLRVTSSHSSVHQNVTLANQEGLADAKYGPDAMTPTTAKQLLGLPRNARLSINGTRSLIYQYWAADRHHPETGEPQDTLQAGPPTLELPPVPDSIVEGAHYVVTELLFSLPVPGWGDLNWRAFIEPVTGAVLYLRAFVAAATGSVFRVDPPTVTGDLGVTPTTGDAVLNPLRTTVPLDGLSAPGPGQPQLLSGQFVQLLDISAPPVAPPTAPSPAAFVYSTSTDDFAAVNAYHHCDWLFRHMQGMGFDIPGYFNGTSFPVRVDHRASIGSCPNGVCVNAQAPGNATGTGSDGFRFALAAIAPAGGTTVGIAADVRVVLHEFSHALLEDSVHSPNFGFAHSAGDSLAAVLLDPDSQLRTAPERFATFPWILPNRRHDRDVAAGWAWGGANDVGGYSSEQILSTTHFRLYRSIGGDADDAARRRLAGRQVAYLIIRGIGSLATSPITPTPNVGVWATTLMNADIGTSNFEGYRGGAYHKVIRWAFERQGLYQPPGAPPPVTQPGAPPNVDVYVDDGRAGQYPWQANFWSTTEIWNRLTADGGAAHQTPVVGVANYAYVRVRNRGTQQASNVVVRGFHCKPATGLVWPGDWQPMTTAQLDLPGGVPSGGSVVAGPFEWTPEVVGHECLLMAVGATDDPSNVDPASGLPCALGPTPEWQLVPFDNNLGQRNLAPVAGGGGLKGLRASFRQRRFWVKNPFDRQVRVELKPFLPQLLAARNWQVRFKGLDGGVFSLAPGAEREIAVKLVPGEEFTAADVSADPNPVIEVHTAVDGAVIGGMSYLLDPALTRPPRERRRRPPAGLTEAGEDLELDEALEAAGEAEATAEGLLELLNLPGASVQSVKIRRITVDIEVTDQ